VPRSEQRSCDAWSLARIPGVTDVEVTCDDGVPQQEIAVDRAELALAAIARPAGHDVAIAGTVEEQRESFRELLVSFALAIALVYMVLACQYESLRDPLVVMFSVPAAAACARS